MCGKARSTAVTTGSGIVRRSRSLASRTPVGIMKARLPPTRLVTTMPRTSPPVSATPGAPLEALQDGARGVALVQRHQAAPIGACPAGPRPGCRPRPRRGGSPDGDLGAQCLGVVEQGGLAGRVVGQVRGQHPADIVRFSDFALFRPGRRPGHGRVQRDVRFRPASSRRRRCLLVVLGRLRNRRAHVRMYRRRHDAARWRRRRPRACRPSPAPAPSGRRARAEPDRVPWRTSKPLAAALLASISG